MEKENAVPFSVPSVFARASSRVSALRNNLQQDSKLCPLYLYFDLIKTTPE